MPAGLGIDMFDMSCPSCCAGAGNDENDSKNSVTSAQKNRLPKKALMLLRMFIRETCTSVKALRLRAVETARQCPLIRPMCFGIYRKAERRHKDCADEAPGRS